MSETALRPKTFPTSSLPGAARTDRCVEHRQWRAARDQVIAATGTIPSLTLVLGPAGTGKTLLLRRLAQHLVATGAEVLVQSRGDLPPEPAGPPGSQARRIVLIDEADRMDAAAMQRLAQLGPCAVVLAGLAGPGGAGGAAYATAVVTLAPLPAGEIRAFVAGWLAQSGLPEDLFDETAVAGVAARSGGVPRLLTSLVNAAMLIARGEGARRVSGRHVDAAAGFRDGGYEQAEPSAPGLGVPGLGVPGLGVPGLGAPGLGAPGLGAPGLGSPESEADPALAVAESRLVDSDQAWTFAHEEYLQSLAAERRQSLRRGAAACTVAAIGALGGWLWFEWAGHDGPTLTVPASASLAPLASAASPTPPRLPPGTAATGPTATPEPAMTPTPMTALASRTSVPNAMRPLPQDALIRVTLRYGYADADAAVRTSVLARSLRAAGFIVDSQPVSRQAAAEPGVRYFFAEDRHAAETVMQAAGLPGQATLVKAAPSAGLPPPGSIELMVPPGATRELPAAAGQTVDHQRN